MTWMLVVVRVAVHVAMHVAVHVAMHVGIHVIQSRHTLAHTCCCTHVHTCTHAGDFRHAVNGILGPKLSFGAKCNML